MSIICGMGDKFTVSVSQEFIWQGTEEEYESWKKEQLCATLLGAAEPRAKESEEDHVSKS